MLKFSSVSVSLVTEFESCETKAYQDQRGIWTIGYGHTAGVAEGLECTVAQAIMWLSKDMTTVWMELKNLLLPDIGNKLTQNQVDALTSFVYNIGSGDFGKSTMRTQLNDGNIALASQQFDLWDYAGDAVSKGLLRRREAEQELFSKGELQDV